MSPDSLTIESLCEGLDLPDWILRFEHAAAGKVVFGPGKLDSLGSEASALGAKRVLIVTDPGLARTGSVSRASESLQEAGLFVSVFDQVHENPTTEDISRCVEAARASSVDVIVGLGGGSSLDTAKGCNFLYTNGGRMHDYWGVGKAKLPMLPFIAIPTTSGTGSECQSFALIADVDSHAKMACGDKKASAAVAILDPELTITMPGKVTAHTGIDAIAHALETAVSRSRSGISSAYSLAAWKLLNSGLEEVLQNPENLEARARMQLGAAFAGTAIENSMLGIAHSCANPLTAHFGIVHGQAVGAMLPYVIEFNRQDSPSSDIYDSLACGIHLAERVRELLAISSMGKRLRELGVDESKLPVLADEAARQWTAQFNPVSVTADTLEAIYRAAL
ncbi:MAG: iron-containing alcohol dehydrogenase [Verrucomicrobiales bacterium]|jgi:alcohol dehydrogenase|nr:iron-containing alcohol dehydrogenase [Verrucomicrobiales bacterium]MBP9224134.1 iron-containing alcohol dehydrogenase [Verrucomicrobiales bacterium]HQZ29523.1 iron-containing alcohol dehydrogenase [Verrucomicrobiales bacterium]